MTTPNQRLDVKAIKAEICRLTGLLKTRPRAQAVGGIGRDRVRLVKLYALRASMKGKLHFSPCSNLAELHGVYGLGQIKLVEAHYKAGAPVLSPTTKRYGTIVPRRCVGNTKRKLTAPQVQETVYRFAAISKKLQAAWVADVAQEFSRPAKTGRDQAREALGAFEKERAT